MNEKYVTPQEAAIMLGVTYGTILNRIKAGTLTATKHGIGNRQYYRLPRAEVLRQRQDALAKLAHKKKMMEGLL